MRFKVFISLLFFCCLFIHAANIQTTITGKVIDNNTHEPLIGVNIIYGNKKGTITNENGEFIFNTKDTLITIVFKYIGYSTQTKSLNLVNKDNVYFEIKLEEVVNELDEIVVTANKTEQKIAELTVSLDLIKPKTLLNNHTTNVSEIISQSPGIEILDGQASIRGGSGYSYGAGSRVLVLINGLPALSADAGDVKWHFLPIENLSQIEIIKGASSVLYGSSALNGIINFRTMQLTEKPILKFTVSSGIYDKPRNNEWIWADKPLTFSNITFFYGKKIKNTSYSFGTNLFIDEGYRKLNDNQSAKCNIHVSHESNKFKKLTYGIDVNTAVAKHQDFILWENADSGALIQNEISAMELNSFILTTDPFIIIKSNSHSSHEIKTRYQTTQNRFLEDFQNNSNAHSLYAEYKYRQAFLKKFDLTSGVSQQLIKVLSSFYDNHTGYNVAGYSQLDFHPVKKLKFVAGIRIEQFSIDNNLNELIPIFRTGLNYKLDDFTFLRASFGQGYRYPSIAEKHGYTTVGTVKIFPNPEIKPESGWSAEIGVKQRLNIRNVNGQIDFSIFNSQNKDMIEYVFGTFIDPVSNMFDFGFQATNVENARIVGCELEFIINAYIGEFNINASNGFTYIYPVEFNSITGKTSKDYLKYRNKFSNKTMLNVSWRKISTGANFNYKSKMLRIDNVFLQPLTREKLLPGFYDYWQKNNTSTFIIDYHINYEITQKSGISLSVKNLLNHEFIGRPGDILPQRSFSLQYVYHF